MSVVEAVRRIADLQAMLASTAPRPSAGDALAPPPGAPATTFDAALARAAGAPPAATAGGGPYAAEIADAAQRHGIDPEVLRAVAQHESGLNPSARSPAGALGLMQLMPATAASLGVTNPLDPVQSLDGGARYLREQLDSFDGDLKLALAAYNAGPGAVQRYGGVPPYAETQRYVQSIMASLGRV